MFGMRKGLKYIKVSGTIRSIGADFQHVIIVDDAGQELQFEALIFPKRLQDEIETGKPCVFYFLRSKTDTKMVGALYALEKNGRKIYYEEEAITVCKTLARQLSNRYQYLRDDKIRLVYLAVCLGIGASIFGLLVSLGQNSILRFIFTPLALVLSGAFFLYSWYPLVRPGSYAGVSEIKKIMDSEGFKSQVFSNSKY